MTARFVPAVAPCTTPAAGAPAASPTGPVESRRVSALYEGWVGHRRLGSPAHAFRARSTMVALDLAELDQVMAAMPLWSARRWAPVAFRRRDYLDGTDRPLADALGDLVQARLGRRPGGPMRLLTQLRRWGWLFNPISLYWCDRPDGRPDAVVLEVTNTPWHERHWYVLDATEPARDFAKQLHVSPFLPMDLTYRLSVRSDGPAATGPGLDVGIQASRRGQPVFEADLSLARIELTAAHALASLARHPLATVNVSSAIHRQALALWAKRVPFQHHPVRSPSGAER